MRPHLRAIPGLLPDRQWPLPHYRTLPDLSGTSMYGPAPGSTKPRDAPAQQVAKTRENQPGNSSRDQHEIGNENKQKHGWKEQRQTAERVPYCRVALESILVYRLIIYVD